MDAHDGRLLGPVRREPVLVRRVGLDRRVVRDVDLLEVELGGELGKVPDVEGEVVGGRGEDAAVAAEAEAGHEVRVVGEVADEVAVRYVPHWNEMGENCKIIAITYFGRLVKLFFTWSKITAITQAIPSPCVISS